MNENTPAAIASAYFSALAKGDLPSAMSLLSPDVVWHQPGANQFSGDHLGLESIGALLGGMMGVSEGSFRLSVAGRAMVNGQLVAVPVEFSGRRADASMETGGIDLLTVRDGRITEVRLFTEDSVAEDAFWGQA